MEETLTYWGHFQIFHANIREISWPILINVTMAICVFSVLRSVFFYAVAKKFGEWQDATLFIWTVETLYNKFLATEEEVEADPPPVTLRGGHIVGGLLDAAAWAIFGTILIWLWPIIFIIAVLFGPIQLCHNRFKKKKLFIARLKGEDLDV